jgi:hypothetical protein
LQKTYRKRDRDIDERMTILCQFSIIIKFLIECSHTMSTLKQHKSENDILIANYN